MGGNSHHVGGIRFSEHREKRREAEGQREKGLFCALSAPVLRKRGIRNPAQRSGAADGGNGKQRHDRCDLCGRFSAVGSPACPPEAGTDAVRSPAEPEICRLPHHLHRGGNGGNHDSDALPVTDERCGAVYRRKRRCPAPLGHSVGFPVPGKNDGVEGVRDCAVGRKYGFARLAGMIFHTGNVRRTLPGVRTTDKVYLQL